MKSNILFMLKKLKIEKKKKTKTIFYFKLYIIVGQNHTQTHPKFLKTFQTHSKFIYFLSQTLHIRSEYLKKPSHCHF